MELNCTHCKTFQVPIARYRVTCHLYGTLDFDHLRLYVFTNKEYFLKTNDGRRFFCATKYILVICLDTFCRQNSTGAREFIIA
jgi:hypothetical protein